MDYEKVLKESGSEDNEYFSQINRVVGCGDQFIWVNIWSGGKRRC